MANCLLDNRVARRQELGERVYFNNFE